MRFITKPIHFLSLFLLILGGLLTINPMLKAESIRCNENNFCSDFLLFKDGRVRSFQPDGMSDREFHGTHFYATIAGNRNTGMTATAITRDNNHIKTINGPNAIRAFDGTLRSEKQALSMCTLCEVIISFRNGCAAVAWSPSEKYFSWAFFEYKPKKRAIKTSGRNPYLNEVEKEALNECPYNDCKVTNSLCTNEPW